MTLEEHSCLLENQSGLVAPAALDEGTVRESLEYRAMDLDLGVTEEARAYLGNLPEYQKPPPSVVLPEDIEVPLTAAELRAENRMGVAAPQWAGIYQAKAATARRRTEADIFYIVWHTPEGSEAGTLAVLNGTRAGFDVFVPLSGRAYKCNDWWNYVAWQAGHWGYNLASIGIEQGDYAANSGSWPESFYDRLAYVCAWMGEVCNIAIRNGAPGVPGYIDHAEITPLTRTDPGVGYRRELMLQKILEYRKGQGPSPVEPQKPQQAEKISVVYQEAASAESFARACLEALKAVGFPADKLGAYHERDDVRWASYKARHGKLGQFVCIIAGKEIIPYLHPEARSALTDSQGNWYSPDQSDLWDCTTDVHTKFRWRIKTVCDRHGLDPEKALELYEQEVA